MSTVCALDATKENKDDDVGGGSGEEVKARSPRNYKQTGWSFEDLTNHGLSISLSLSLSCSPRVARSFLASISNGWRDRAYIIARYLYQERAAATPTRELDRRENAISVCPRGMTDFRV